MRDIRSLDALVTDVASDLIGVDASSVSTAYTRVLRTLVEFFDLHAGYLRHTDYGDRSTVMVAEWPPRPDAPEPDPLGIVYFADADPVFAACEHLVHPKVFRPTVGNEDYRQRIEAASGYPVTSMAVVPLVQEKSIGWVGLIKSGDRAWSEGETNALVAIASMFTQVHARILAEESLRLAAESDALTGLANRRGFTDDLLRRLSSDAGPVAVLFLDLDRLKALNDFYGHSAGDEYLRALADTLRAVLPPEATIARWGGDEFVVVMQPSVLDDEPTSPYNVARRVLDAVATTRVTIAGDDITRTASIGVTTAMPGVERVDDIIANADQAALVAKHRGGNSVVLFDSAIRAHTELRNDVELHLRDAISNGDLVLHFQPEVDLRTGDITAVEALVRWQHPTRGLLPPSDFIDIAESSELATELGRWVLVDAMRAHSDWASRIPGLDIVMRVNVSPAQLLATEFVDIVEQALDNDSVPPTVLCLEVTENAVVQDTGQTAKILTMLRELGVGIAIDDFGTGFSSLAHLKVLPLDALKIDGEFVKNLDCDANDQVIVGAIATLAAAFGLELLAEGVETEAAKSALMVVGCDRAQGYLFSRPVPEAKMLEMLARGAIH
ncbi:bifunctional diguanylate cyclase/phosphodiesterase [Rhodococcus sp. H29-C3]|uniref:putative bifunctional diguanylate cyclase/phosphodiesterase n=1 Tax=Rhodococcus sp. H29-C3 TaxID=3046307 RepID=UPI0024BBCE85|nr:bifunctional diguanylate cyclase/phosphodiesterase [Rhodococcus sp. H29-C3]MDJ0359439.1 bifunctional diguanylate cyclase/phosphodiesterase [Rhodococcus sp. H29-C3]